MRTFFFILILAIGLIFLSKFTHEKDRPPIQEPPVESGTIVPHYPCDLGKCA